MDNKRPTIIVKTLLICASFILASLSQAETLPKDFEYIYSLSKNDFTIANINRKLKVSADKFIFTSYAYPVGFASLFVSDTITEQSIISTADKQLRTQSYSYVKQADVINEQFHIRFDWQQNIASDSRMNKAFSLPGQAFDILSFQLALAHRLKKQQQDFRFTLIENKRIKTYELQLHGTEPLQTDAGQFETVKLEYYDDNKHRRIILWCAKQLDFLPVQITRIDDDGDTTLLKLISRTPATAISADENNNDF